MSTFVKILAVIGALVILGIVVVAGLVTWGVSSVLDRPDYANVQTLDQAYGSDLTQIRNRLRAEESLAYSENDFALGDDVLAIITENGPGSSQDLYQRHDAVKRSHVIINKAGTGKIRVDGEMIDALVYEIDSNGKSHLVFLKDRLKDAEE